MKLLLDTCMSGQTRQELEEAGHDVVWANDWPKDPGDDEILAVAHREGSILVTLDKDFGELAVARGEAHSGIIRLVNLSVRQQADVCLRIFELYGEELEASAIVTAEPGWVRIRQADVNDDAAQEDE